MTITEREQRKGQNKRYYAEHKEAVKAARLATRVLTDRTCQLCGDTFAAHLARQRVCLTCLKMLKAGMQPATGSEYSGDKRSKASRERRQSIISWFADKEKMTDAYMEMYERAVTAEHALALLQDINAESLHAKIEGREEMCADAAAKLIEATDALEKFKQEKKMFDYRRVTNVDMSELRRSIVGLSKSEVKSLDSINSSVREDDALDVLLDDLMS